MKRLKNIEGKNEEQLKAIEYQGENQLKIIKDQIKNQLKAVMLAKLADISNLKIIKLHEYGISEKGEEVAKILINLNNNINYQYRLYKSGDKIVYNFYAFKSMFELFQGLMTGQISMYNGEL